jgi:[acyl-carrier-protein] S-malonyltransferase
LVVNGTLPFEDALKLVSIRAMAMQKACELNPSAMAAVLALPDEEAERICKEITAETGEIVVPANFNCPGQLVISGSNAGIDIACEKMKAAGAKRALKLPVGGAFHSPLMEPARRELQDAIAATNFKDPVCPVYQNVNAKPSSNPDTIKENLIAQLTAPVRWTQSAREMASDGAVQFIECGPGKVLQGLIKKIVPEAEVSSL